MTSKRMRVVVSESALADLESVIDYYAEQGASEVGRKFVLRLLDALPPLESHTELGRVVPEFSEPSLRELIRPPFRIVYKVSAGKILVARFWRSERLLRPDAAHVMELQVRRERGKKQK